MRNSAPFPAVLILLGIVSCDTDIEDYDHFPIPVETEAGPVLIQARSNDSAAFWATVDTLAPVSVVDGAALGGEPQPPRRRVVDLTAVAQTLPDADPVLRARFPDSTVLDLNPCGTGAACPVGLDGATRAIGGILGADLLSRGAVRFDFPGSAIYLYPQIAGSARARARACEATFESPFFGGGTMLIGGGEIGYDGFRVAIGACADFDARTPSSSNRGVAMTLLLSTGLGTTIIGEAAYDRYRAFYADAADPPPTLGALPTATVHIASGPIHGRLGQLRRIALVGQGAEDRGPCQELYANHVMSVDGCREDTALEVRRCPCTDSRFCDAAAAVELDRPIDVLVVPDDQPMLQALRDETRPALPEVDGLLGARALAQLGVDVDYPNARVLMRCLERDQCVTRPAVIDNDILSDLQRCPGI